VSLILSVLPALFETKEAWHGVKNSAGRRRLLPAIELVVLWTLPLVAIVLAVAADRASSATDAKLVALQEQLRQRPLDQRLREFLNGLEQIGPKLIAAIVSSADESVLCRAEMTLDKAAEFRRLCAEPGAEIYVTLVPPEKDDAAIESKDTGMIVTQVRFRVSKALFPAERAAAIENKARARSISAEQRAKFSSLAKDAPKCRITVHFIADNEESHAFAIQLHKLLSEAGYTVTSGVWPTTIFGTPVVGVTLCPRDGKNPPDAAKALQALLREIEVDAPGEGGNTSLGVDELRLTVGLKP
jgi:hypothetical protein